MNSTKSKEPIIKWPTAAQELIKDTIAIAATTNSKQPAPTIHTEC